MSFNFNRKEALEALINSATRASFVFIYYTISLFFLTSRAVIQTTAAPAMAI